MRILEREVECLDISQLRANDRSRVVVVYQKEGDCRRENLENPKYCRKNCYGLFMSFEFQPTGIGVYMLTPQPEKFEMMYGLADLLFPPLECFNEAMEVYNVHNLDELDEFCKRRGIPIIQEGEDKIYKVKGVMGIKRNECGMVGIPINLPHPSKDFMGQFPFIEDACETFDGIKENMKDLEKDKRKRMTDEEKFREASKIVNTPDGEELLAIRFGDYFVSKAKEYGKGKHEAKH